MTIRSVSKAIAGGVVTGVPGAIATMQIIPADVEAPWWGYVLAYAVWALVGFLGVYIAPANRPSTVDE